MAGNSWQESDGKLFKRFEFDSFMTALKFVNKVGELAEKANHHPDINLGWGYAQISLTTHSEHAITEKDKKLSIEIDRLL